MRRRPNRSRVHAARLAPPYLVGQVAPTGSQKESGRHRNVTAAVPPSASLEEFNALLDRVFDDRVRQWTAEAERTEKFPRELLEYLAKEGVFTAKWGQDTQ